jgi:hypothetical protein
MFENFLGKSPADILAEETKAAEKAAADLTAAIIAASKKEAPPPSAPAGAVQFNPAREYRIHFENGNSGEYSGAALANGFPFDPFDVASIEEIG